jgi:hypothetical protein
MPKLSRVEEATRTARGASGRFVKVQCCDFCQKPVTGEHFTDSRVCGGTDGPGFYLCDRKRCIAKRDALEAAEGVEGLRKAYIRKS